MRRDRTFREQMFDVLAKRLAGDAEDPGDFRTAFSLIHLGKHFALSRREARRPQRRKIERW